MHDLLHGPHAARTESDFVVFLIGARLERFRDFRA